MLQGSSSVLRLARLPVQSNGKGHLRYHHSSVHSLVWVGQKRCRKTVSNVQSITTRTVADYNESRLLRDFQNHVNLTMMQLGLLCVDLGKLDCLLSLTARPHLALLGRTMEFLLPAVLDHSTKGRCIVLGHAGCKRKHMPHHAHRALLCNRAV